MPGCPGMGEPSGLFPNLHVEFQKNRGGSSAPLCFPPHSTAAAWLEQEQLRKWPFRESLGGGSCPALDIETIGSGYSLVPFYLHDMDILGQSSGTAAQGVGEFPFLEVFRSREDVTLRDVLSGNGGVG